MQRALLITLPCAALLSGGNIFLILILALVVLVLSHWFISIYRTLFITVMITDHDFMSAIEYLPLLFLFLSYFMLLYFVYHCKLPYIPLDIGNDE